MSCGCCFQLNPMATIVASDFQSRLRGWWNRLVFNPWLTGLYDRIWPQENLGNLGERYAERFLRKKGLIIVEQGYSDEMGEIDLIAVDKRTIVFVEVKTRRSDIAGSPAEAVDQQKQEKIVRTALSYLKRHQLHDCRSRFDVISIVWAENSQSAQLTHFENAFEAGPNCW